MVRVDLCLTAVLVNGTGGSLTPPHPVAVVFILRGIGSTGSTPTDPPQSGRVILSIGFFLPISWNPTWKPAGFWERPPFLFSNIELVGDAGHSSKR